MRNICHTTAFSLSRLLYDVYRVGQDTPLRVEPKGQWSPAAGYKLWDNFSGSWLRRRSNLGNITLIGSTAASCGKCVAKDS